MRVALPAVALFVISIVPMYANATSIPIVNAGFEAPVLTPGTSQAFTPGQTIGGGWTVLGNPGTDVALIQTSYSEPLNNVSQFNAQAGLNSLDVTGLGNVGSSAGIQQIVSTSAGQPYLLSFFVGRVTPSGGPGGFYVTPATVDLSINGGARVSFTNSDVTNDMINWKQFSFPFIAAGSSTTIAFLNGTPVGSSLAGLDNVSLVTVPEPGGVTMAIIIAAGIAGFSRRRLSLREY